MENVSKDIRPSTVREIRLKWIHRANLNKYAKGFV